jgi:hypothetical protein
MINAMGGSARVGAGIDVCALRTSWCQLYVCLNPPHSLYCIQFIKFGKISTIDSQPSTHAILELVGLIRPQAHVKEQA